MLELPMVEGSSSVVKIRDSPLLDEIPSAKLDFRTEKHDKSKSSVCKMSVLTRFRVGQACNP